MYFPLLFSISALLIAAFSFFYFKSYIKNRTSRERFLSEFREEVDGILRSINEITDRDISLIEDREAKTKNLLEEIDKRLKVYIRELESRKEAEETLSNLASQEKRKAPPENKESATYQELGKNRYRSFPIPDFEVKQEPPPDAPIGEQIHSLLRAGLSIPAIASRLGISVAQAEITVALLDRRENQ